MQPDLECGFFTEGTELHDVLKSLMICLVYTDLGVGGVLSCLSISVVCCCGVSVPANAAQMSSENDKKYSNIALVAVILLAEYTMTC